MVLGGKQKRSIDSLSTTNILESLLTSAISNGKEPFMHYILISNFNLIYVFILITFMIMRTHIKVARIEIFLIQNKI